MCFGLGQLYITEEVGVGDFSPLGMACLETKKIVLVPSTRLEGRRYLPPPYPRRKSSLSVEISQFAFLGPERRVWREDLSLILVPITASAVAMMERGCLWQVCLVGYRCGVRVGTSEVEEDSSSEVMGCASSEEMRGAYQYLGECVVVV